MDCWTTCLLAVALERRVPVFRRRCLTGRKRVWQDSSEFSSETSSLSELDISELVSCSSELPIPVLPETTPFVEAETGSATDICFLTLGVFAGAPLLLVSVDTGPYDQRGFEIIRLWLNTQHKINNNKIIYFVKRKYCFTWCTNEALLVAVPDPA